MPTLLATYIVQFPLAPAPVEDAALKVKLSVTEPPRVMVVALSEVAMDGVGTATIKVEFAIAITLLVPLKTCMFQRYVPFDVNV